MKVRAQKQRTSETTETFDERVSRLLESPRHFVTGATVTYTKKEPTKKIRAKFEELAARLPGPLSAHIIAAEDFFPEAKSNQASTQEVIDKFLVSKRGANLSDITIRSYQDTFSLFARAYSTLPNQPQQLDKYLARYRGENSTAWNIFTRIRLLYTFAEERELLSFPNPFTKMKPPKKVINPPQHLTQGEVEAYLRAIIDDRERGLVVCLYGLGLRLKETRLLSVGDIGEDIIYTIHGKERQEPALLHPEFRQVLAPLIQGKRPDEYLFPGRNGKPLSDSQVQNIIKAIGLRAGITRVTVSPHMWRHTKGVGANLLGIDTYSMRRLLRHTTTQMTDRYEALNLDELRQKDRQFNPLLLIMKNRLGIKPDCAQCQPDVEVAPSAKEPYTDAEQDASHDAEVETGDG